MDLYLINADGREASRLQSYLHGYNRAAAFGIMVRGLEKHKRLRQLMLEKSMRIHKCVGRESRPCLLG